MRGVGGGPLPTGRGDDRGGCRSARSSLTDTGSPRSFDGFLAGTIAGFFAATGFRSSLAGGGAAAAAGSAFGFRERLATTAGPASRTAFRFLGGGL
jgi:hypothetical protein